MSNLLTTPDTRLGLDEIRARTERAAEYQRKRGGRWWSSTKSHALAAFKAVSPENWLLVLDEVSSRVSLEAHAAGDHDMAYRGAKALILLREYPGILDDNVLFAWEQKVSGLLNDEDQHVSVSPEHKTAEDR